MPESRINEVAQALLSQSKDHEVAWEESSKRGSYRVVFPDVVLAISREDGIYEERGDIKQGILYKLELMNETGRVIETLDSKPEDTTHTILGQIFDLAEQHVRDRGIDKALGYLKGR